MSLNIIEQSYNGVASSSKIMNDQKKCVKEIVSNNYDKWSIN